MMRRRSLATPELFIAGILAVCSAGAFGMSESMTQCLMSRLETADFEMTVGELYGECAEEVAEDSPALTPTPDSAGVSRESVVDIRRSADYDSRTRQFSISPYRANYILTTYNSNLNEDPFEVEPEEFLEEHEAKFQVSFQMPVATDLFGGNTDLMFAYTSVAWWQLYNEDISRPFRETNYEPEVFFRTYTDADFLGMDMISWEIGYNHQSNGQSLPTSRGWDRIVGSSAFELSEDLVLGLRAWAIIDEQDTNADIDEYMGYGDVSLLYAPNRSTFTAVYRPAKQGDAIQLTWSYPLSKYLRVYAQYWNGYGESLIDYNIRTQRFGLGIALNDILSRD